MSNYAPPPPPPAAAGNSADPAQKSRIAAGILGILLGGLGIHRFYLGYVGIGIAQIAVTIVTLGVGSIWGLVEGILILTGNGITKDAKGRPLRD
jgi:TM2 domain-containing membrane protein YozV